jgi:aryl-alcohol dehydrogenase-like predicted oxidoreductase
MNEHTRTESFAHPPSTLRIGDLDVRRLGYGTIRLPGDGVWGEPDDPAHARTLLRRAVELGINFLDTASFYGPLVSNRLIFEALHPYPRDLVIATKLGTKRLPNKGWAPAARPEELRRAVETDLRTLRVERLDVVHLRFMARSGVPLIESIDALVAMQAEGKIGHLALSCVDARQIEAVLARTPIVAVQNAFGVGGVDAALARTMNAEVDAPEAVLELCTARGIAYVPFLALRGGKLSQGKRATVAAIAARHGASPSQIALAWLWARSPVILPIPGTRSLAHLEENWAARRIALSPEEIDAIAR